MTTPLRVGLIGAGPWAERIHAPGLFNHPDTTLTTVWARRPEAAGRLADAYGANISATVDHLLDQVDAVAFAVPPAVQVELGIRAANAGKHLILEKPLAPNVDAAQRLVSAAEQAGVATLMMLTLRYLESTQDWLADLVNTKGWTGGNVQWLSAALLSERYGNSLWRHESGALADIGPHALDLIDAALGTVKNVLAANRTDDDLWHLLLEHESGATSTVSLSLRLPLDPAIVEFLIYGKAGYRTLGRAAGIGPESYAILLSDLTAMISSGSRKHRCDIHRGLHLQRLLDQARLVASEQN